MFHFITPDLHNRPGGREGRYYLHFADVKTEAREARFVWDCMVVRGRNGLLSQATMLLALGSSLSPEHQPATGNNSLLEAQECVLRQKIKGLAESSIIKCKLR